MERRRATLAIVMLGVGWGGARAGTGDWWNPRWRFRTTVTRPTPYRSAAPRPVEVAADFALLLRRAGVEGEFDPGSVRVVERGQKGAPRVVPFAWRTELDYATGRRKAYLAWTARPQVGLVGAFEVYFDTKDRALPARRRDGEALPPANLLANPGFEEQAKGVPAGWRISSPALVRLGKFAHTTGRRSLRITVDEKTPAGAPRELSVSQRIDVRAFAGREMVFECDLLAERAAYGAPVSVELQQFRADGSRIRDFAVQPRWLTIELAEGQFVQFRQRGRFRHDAAAVDVVFRFRCSVRDADTGARVRGPEACFTVWLDRVVVRPGERWPWPARAHGAFVRGALSQAPINRGFAFTGLRRLAFNGASEGTLTGGRFSPDARSVHWGLRAGTLEFWCRPRWSAGDGAQHVFFYGRAYGHRLQSRLRKLDAAGGNRLEFTIADAGGTPRRVRGPAKLRAGQWHHVAATWDFARAELQLFVDGRRIGSVGPGRTPWPARLLAVGKTRRKGMGIAEYDARSLPMQAFIGGDSRCRASLAANAVLDEFRISDVVRYREAFTPPRAEFDADAHTRALFHFENERHGTQGGDDRFVRGHLACEQPRQREHAPLESLRDGKIERRSVLVKPRAAGSAFEAKRAESRLPVRRPLRKLPDPRFVAWRRCRAERTVREAGEAFELTVGGDYAPRMLAVTFEHADASAAATTPLPRWRANDNVVPFSAADLAATLAPGVSDEAARAFEVFRYALSVTNYYDAHYCETLPGRHRPRVSYTLTKALNIYPFDQCGPLNHTLRKLFLAAGISSNDASGTHHQFQQAYYKGSWRLFDLSPRLYWLNRDAATVAGRRAFEEDPYLKLRQGSGITSALRGRRSRARFGWALRPHRMAFRLQPGERASVCWHNEGRWFELTGSRKPIPLAKIPPYFGNGAIVYEPRRARDAGASENLLIEPRGDRAAAVRARDPARAASLVYRVQCPYILSDGRVRGAYGAKAPGAIRLAVSFDGGKSWAPVWRSGERSGRIDAGLRPHVTARYAYWLKLTLAAGSGAEVTGLHVRTTLAASPLALPGRLRQGKNRIRFVGGRSAGAVRTACQWVERRRSDLGVSLNAISYYLNGGEAHRNLLVAAPGRELPVTVKLWGRPLKGEVAMEGLPKAWTGGRRSAAAAPAGAAKTAVAKLAFTPKGALPGEIRGFDVVVRAGARERRVSAQVLVAAAGLVREAEQADRAVGRVSRAALPEASGAALMAFGGAGKLTFDLAPHRAGKHALWLRAWWQRGSTPRLTLRVEEGKVRTLRAAAMIGFTDWTDPARAHTKMFAHYGEQYGHASWYRVGDVELSAGRHRLTLGAGAGARLDAAILLPQEPAMDRAAMNLLQNWNYAPWDNPL